MQRYIAFPFLLISISVICYLLATLIDNKTCKSWKYDVKTYKLIKLKRWNYIFLGMKDTSNRVIICPLAIKNILGYLFIINAIVLSITYFILPPAEGLSNLEWAMITSMGLNVFTLAFTNVFEPLSSFQKDKIEVREKQFSEKIDQLLFHIIELEEKLPISAKNFNCTYRPFHQVNILIQSITLKIIIRYSKADILDLDCYIIESGHEIGLHYFLQQNNLKIYELNGINTDEKIKTLDLVIEEILNLHGESVDHK